MRRRKSVEGPELALSRARQDGTQERYLFRTGRPPICVLRRTPQLHKPSRVTGTRRTSEGLDLRRRRALYRAWHRGLREMDIILGRFTDAEIEHLSEAELDEFEHLLEAPDTNLYEWVSGRAPTPAEYDNAIFRRLVAFHAAPRAE